jgi:predicted DNA-binding protein
MTDATPLLVRMPPDMHQAVKQRADAEDRTMSAVVRRAIRTHLESDAD